MSEPTRSWEDVRGDVPVNEARSAIYQRLMEAEERIAQALYQLGVDHEVVQAALDRVDESLSQDERREDLYLSALERFVEALGGRLEVRAVFGDQTVVVRQGSI